MLSRLAFISGLPSWFLIGSSPTIATCLCPGKPTSLLSLTLSSACLFPGLCLRVVKRRSDSCSAIFSGYICSAACLPAAEAAQSTTPCLRPSSSEYFHPPLCTLLLLPELWTRDYSCAVLRLSLLRHQSSLPKNCWTVAGSGRSGFDSRWCHTHQNCVSLTVLLLS